MDVLELLRRRRPGARAVGAFLLLIAVPAVLGSRRLAGLFQDDPQRLGLALAWTARVVSDWSAPVAGLLAMLAGGREGGGPEPLLGLDRLRDIIERVAPTSATVVLRGESGVGKERVARAIHAASPRRDRPFVKVNCAAVPAALLESEFFGHERGAFSGAERRKSGRFEQAEGGTLLLDEVAELPPELQAKLLHVLQDSEYFLVGGTRSMKCDVRIMAATHRDLEDLVARGAFRADLYYRLKVVEIVIPPLRARREEIPVLVQHFLRRLNAEHGRAVSIDPRTLALFLRYEWPGNIRELENYLRRIVVLEADASVAAELEERLRAPVPGNGRGVATPTSAEVVGLKEVGRRAAREAERAAIVATLERVRWNRLQASRLLGISYRALLYKVAEYRLTRSGSPPAGSPPAA